MKTKLNKLALIGLAGLLASPSVVAAQGMGKGLVGSYCQAEIAKYCANVAHGTGAVPACLATHKKSLSPQCQQALANKGPGGGLGQGQAARGQNVR